MPPRVLDWLTDAFGHPSQQELWEQCLNRVTPLGRSTSGETRVKPLGVLQLCIMGTEPFRECGENQVRALYYDPPLPFPSKNWGLLIESLAKALFNYLVAPHAWLLEGERLAEKNQEVLQGMKHILVQCEVLRRRRKIHPISTGSDDRSYITTKSLEEAYQLFEQAVAQIGKVVGSFDYWVEQKAFLPLYRRQLSYELYGAFEQYGPPYHRRKWPKGVSGDQKLQ
jgi:hypothetical protein